MLYNLYIIEPGGFNRAAQYIDMSLILCQVNDFQLLWRVQTTINTIPRKKTKDYCNYCVRRVTEFKIQ